MPLFHRVDVCEKTENPRSMKGTGRKSVDMEKIVPRPQSQFSPLLLKRSKTGKIVSPIFGIGE